MSNLKLEGMNSGMKLNEKCTGVDFSLFWHRTLNFCFSFGWKCKWIIYLNNDLEFLCNNINLIKRSVIRKLQNNITIKSLFVVILFLNSSYYHRRLLSIWEMISLCEVWNLSIDLPFYYFGVNALYFSLCVYEHFFSN